jgi:hypothetical protein
MSRILQNGGRNGTSRQLPVGLRLVWVDAVSSQQEEFGMKIGVLGSGIVAQTLATGFRARA